MVRGRTTAPIGQTLGHEITGEIVETGDDVLFVKPGDICSVPFNIACGRCRMCNEGKTGICLNVNPARPGAAYGYVDMGGWIGGQAEYVMVPFADFNLLKFPDRDQALEKILDLTMLSDIFPTGYHGAYTAGVTTGSTVYVAGAGPVGLAAAHAAQLLGASVVIVGDMIPERLAQARSFGCETVDLTADGRAGGDDRAGRSASRWSTRRWTRSGSRPAGTARGAGEQPATVLNDVMTIARAGASHRHPGPVRDRRPGRRRRERQGRPARRAHRARLGEVAPVHHRSVPGEAVQPAADEPDPERQGADREGGQRHDDQAGRGAAGLPGLRPRCGARSTCSTRTAWSRPDPGHRRAPLVTAGARRREQGTARFL